MVGKLLPLASNVLDPSLQVESESDGGHDQARLPGPAPGGPGKDHVGLPRARRQDADERVTAACRADGADALFLPWAQVCGAPGGIRVEAVRCQLPVRPAGRAAGRLRSGAICLLQPAGSHGSAGATDLRSA